MSDAEYWSEQQESEARNTGGSSGQKEVSCWINDVEYEIWDWALGRRILDLFKTAHREAEIGSEVFTASDIIPPGDEELSSEVASLGATKEVSGLTFVLSSEEQSPRYEVIIVSRAHIPAIKKHTTRLQECAPDLEKESIGEMWQAIAEFMEEEDEIKTFVFTREI